MNISLESRTKTTAWASFFTLVGYELSVPIWHLLNIPKEMQENPGHLIEIAKYFYSGDRAIPLKKELLESQTNRYLEARRLTDLGHLYMCFGRLLGYYSEKAVQELYEVALINFVGELSTLWDSWHQLFSRLRTKESWIDPLGQDFRNHLIRIVNARFRDQGNKQQELQTRWKEMCETYCSDLERNRDALNELLPYDIRNPQFTNLEGFEDPCEELSWVFDFESMILHDCAAGIWKDMNKSFDSRSLNEFFEIAILQLAAIDVRMSQEILRLKEVYLES